MRLVVSDKFIKLTSLLVVILWLSPTLIEFTAVSYTHLDVYKRQL